MTVTRLQHKMPFNFVCLVAASVLSYAGDSPKNFKPSDFSGPVFKLQAGSGGFYAIAEGENLPHSSKWVKRTDSGKTGTSGCTSKGAVGASYWDPAHYTGTGYVRWTGGSLGSGGSQESDANQTLQGSKSDWLLMKIWAEPNQAGTYKCTPRVYHAQQDGDNDWWAAYIGKTGTISRAANCNVQQYAYTSWGGSNLTSVNIVAGLNAVYIAGRSNGIGVDRIVVTNMGGSSSAYDGATPQSPEHSTSSQVNHAAVQPFQLSTARTEKQFTRYTIAGRIRNGTYSPGLSIDLNNRIIIGK